MTSKGRNSSRGRYPQRNIYVGSDAGRRTHRSIRIFRQTFHMHRLTESHAYTYKGMQVETHIDAHMGKKQYSRHALVATHGEILRT